MSVNLLKTAGYVVVAIAAVSWAIGWGSTPAYAQGCCGSHAGHGAGSAGHQHGDAPGDHAGHNQPVPAPHSGQLTAAPPLTFEVVYLPQEIRVYLFGLMPYSASAKDVTGEVSLQLRNDTPATRVPLRPVAVPANQQDYLSAAVDLSRVKDGDLTATFKLASLPLENHLGITFGQAVVVSQAKPQVTVSMFNGVQT